MKVKIENIIEVNSLSLEREFQWFASALDTRFKTYFNTTEEVIEFPLPPDLEKDESSYAQVIKKYAFGIEERLVLCLAMCPHFKTQLLDLFFTNNPQLNRPFTEFGGYSGKDHVGFLPTGETAAFLLAPSLIQDRVKLWEMFGERHAFAIENIIRLEKTDPNEPLLSGKLLINDELLYSLTIGKPYLSESNDLFPATRIQTEMEWEDLVVSPYVKEEILQVKSWIEHQDTLLKDPVFSKHIKPGFRSLFYGLPGTGKTMTAMLLGKSTGLDVYKIDLSLIVSKYIGETEKNLSRIFENAEAKNWILFFDEADALFGKRTEVDTSHDKYANQEVSYLLQRIENFSGIVILASNLKSNMDEAFSRRFQSIIFFRIPDKTQRLRLWKNIFSGQIKPESSVDLERLAKDFELSGGSMINVLRKSTLKTIQKGQDEISYEVIIESIRKEYLKFGKTI